MGDEPNGGLGAAIAEVVNSNQDAVAAVTGRDPAGENPAEGQVKDGTAPPENAPGESQPSTVDTQQDPATGDGEVAKKLEPFTDQDGRVVYWGQDLTGIPAEKQLEIIEHFEQQDSTIRKLHERLAKEPEPAKPNQEPELEEISDEALLKAAGYEPDDPDSARLVPLLRNQLALEDTVEELKRGFQANQVETSWNKALDELESVHGKLPGDRLQVLRYAAEEGIASPYEVYFRLTAPAKKEVSDLVQRARREAAKESAGGGLKPSSTTTETPAIEPGTSLRDAVRIAAENAEKTTGLSWSAAVKSRLVTGAQGPKQ